MFVVIELFVKRATQSLDATAGKLAFNHRRVDRAADIVGDHEALHLGLTGLFVDPDGGKMDAIGEDRVIGVEIAFRREMRLAPTQQLGARHKPAR